MRVLYGVTGQGLGHCMRSRVIIEHLLRHGHEVEIVTSARAVDYLERRFSSVNSIHGFHIVTKKNQVRRARTVMSNLVSGTRALPRQLRAFHELSRRFRPDVVISDFDTWTQLYAELHRVPLLSIDNMQILNRCMLPSSVTRGHRLDFEIARTIVRSKLPLADFYFITTFFYPDVRYPSTSLFPPILRSEILETESKRGEHLLVYQTEPGNSRLLDVLSATGLECRVYGMRPGIRGEERVGRIRFRPLGEAGFIEDLASARAVVASAGFTLMSEAIYLHKPLLAVPLRGQFEQILNARYLEQEGYGMSSERIDFETLNAFIQRLSWFEKRLARYHQRGNELLLGALDRQLIRIGAIHSSRARANLPSAA